VGEFPRTTKALRDALEEAGLAPRKRHGQCFLTDAQAVDAIVRDAGVEAGDAVVEVGTGTGLLTHALVEAGASVETFDLDVRIQEFAKALREWPPTVVFHAEDALESKHALSPALLDALARARSRSEPGHAKFVSNLPYNAATPVLLALLALPDAPDSITAMVQLEVAQKLLSEPGDEGYGPPSILRALSAEGRVLRRFPAQVFWPQPSVKSALLGLWPTRPPAARPEEHRAFSEFLLGLFSRRRKILSTALRVARPAATPDEAAAAIAAAGLDPRLRPEDVAPEALLDLFRRTANDRRPVRG
jgi:16S rRNA (adenine1518-N6/adenine1519-N6)-dimethyltransferase